jgi:Secretion system C-terminal sorting domain
MTILHFKQKFIIGFLLTSMQFGAVFSQNNAPFSIEPDTSAIATVLDPNEIESIADAHVTNLTPNDLTIRWRRNFLSGSQGTQVKVCDINTCYGVNVITKEFVLAGNADGLLSVHLVHNSATSLNAVVRVDLWDVNQLPTPDTLKAFYVFNDATTFATNFLYDSNMEVYPNPAQDQVQITHAEQVSQVRIFGVDGREYQAVNVEQSPTFSVATLPVGSYVLMLTDKNNKILDVKELIKQ